MVENKDIIWSAALSNGEVVNEVKGDVGGWRRLAERCVRDNLTIVNLHAVCGDRIDLLSWPPSRTHFFVLHDLTSFLKGGRQILRKGLACVYRDDHGRHKVKVFWHGGQPVRRQFTQVGSIQDFPAAAEVGIPIS